MSEDPLSDSGNEKQLLRARREAAFDKKKRDSISKKRERCSIGMHPYYRKFFDLSVDHRQAPVVAFGATNMGQKFVFHVEKKDIFNTVAPSREINLPEYELDRDWEYSQNCNEPTLVRDRFEQNKNSWKNEFKLSDFVQNIIGND